MRLAIVKLWVQLPAIPLSGTDSWRDIHTCFHQ